MRVRTLVWVAIGLALAAVIGFSRADPDKDAAAARITGLIRQLGSPEFARREAAGKELEAIGEPALDALRKAANDRDPEIRKRAEQILLILNERFRAAIAKKELGKWQGNWFGEDDHKMTIKDDKWTASTPTFGPNSGTLKGIDVKETMTHVDLVVEEGPTKGQTCKAILRLDGGTLHYCGTYTATRPTEFKSQGGNAYVAFKRVKPAPRVVVQPVVEVQLLSSLLPTDLPLDESKAGIRRVSLKIWLTDGGSGSLTLDPNAPKLDRFGDPAPPGKPLPVVRLDCTLKLVKQEKDRQLYEIRGPKLVSRLSLVAYKSTMPWGDGRLLVHGKDGTVRYAIDLSLPQQQQFPPCHPGCFPAGTAIRVPGGAKPIELIREGDLVITTDADGKPSTAKVTGLFATRNRVLDVHVEGAKLVTTETQPLALESGGYRPAGELKSGDRIWRWTGAARKAVTVQSVTAADRETQVFNLVLGEPRVFIAGDFLARSKPPPILP